MASERSHQPGLRRELRFIEAIALSLAIMAPTAAMALNGTAVAGLIGRAVPLAFLIATIGVLFVSYGFVRLTRYFNSAGSVFALAGATLGPRAGFFAGFALMGTYTLFADRVGRRGRALRRRRSSTASVSGNVDWLIIGIVAMVFIAIFAFGDIRVATRTLLEPGGHLGHADPRADRGHLRQGDRRLRRRATRASRSACSRPPSGISLSAIAVASVFGFLSFGGFEGAASLGEETDDPGRNIPRAILIAVVAAGHVLRRLHGRPEPRASALSDAGIKRFSESSGAARRPRARTTSAPAFADVINFGATMSAFAATLGRRHRGLADPVRDRARRVPRQRAGSRVGALRRSGRRAHGDPRLSR